MSEFFPHPAPVADAATRAMIAKALFAEQLRCLSLTAAHGGGDVTKGVAKLMFDAFERRREEIIAEVCAAK